MSVKQKLMVFAVMAFTIVSCSKKQQPQATAISTTEKTVEKTVVKKPVKMPRAKVITVDDRAAKKTPDGRFYYDFDGKRYWKNYDDGKYYLYSKTMYTDPAFKPH